MQAKYVIVFMTPCTKDQPPISVRHFIPILPNRTHRGVVMESGPFPYWLARIGLLTFLFVLARFFFIDKSTDMP